MEFIALMGGRSQLLTPPLKALMTASRSLLSMKDAIKLKAWWVSESVVCVKCIIARRTPRPEA